MYRPTWEYGDENLCTILIQPRNVGRFVSFTYDRKEPYGYQRCGDNDREFHRFDVKQPPDERQERELDQSDANGIGNLSWTPSLAARHSLKGSNFQVADGQ